MKNKLCWIIAGGLAFWLPAILVSAIFHEQAGLIMLNVAPFLGLIVLALVVWIRDKKSPSWGYVVAGVYILGPAALLTASQFSGAQPPDSLGSYAFLVLVCLLPPMTLWLSLFNGMIFSVLTATLAPLPLLLVAQIRKELSDHWTG